jgi:hypothetical protein
MDHSLADRLSRLASEAQALAETIRDGDGPEGRTRRHAHRLRTHLGVALVLAERLAQQTGNDRMVTMNDHGDTGTVCYEIALDETEILDVEAQ